MQDYLFRYINQFLKLKQQADGWPSWAKTEEEKARYLNDYFEREGIALDPNSIEKNSGLRSLAKLMLNSFWGKVSQSLYLWKLNEFYHVF